MTDLDKAHRNFSAHSASEEDLALLIESDHIYMIPVYTLTGAEHAESLKLLERSE